ncbi:MAG TPA: SOS response-associated peptidase [Micromonosporaceae bacterium]|jgi:putative SOS response-associated peptidase YedK|nr:SOS response-associated peptidase [Micromonosporaceae bacterium]
MCGRYATTRSEVDLAALFEADDGLDGGAASARTPLVPDYNVAPTDPVPIVRTVPGGTARSLAVARWGLLPHWARDPRAAARMINARAETVAASRAFGPSFAQRRCLIPADGWYEWVKDGAGRRQPYYMTPLDGSVLAFAGLWTTWGSGDQRRLTSSIVTMPALGDLALVHSRMPLALPPGRWAQWLGGDPDPAALLAPPPDEYLAGLEIRPVGVAVGDVHNDGPSLLTRVDAPPLASGSTRGSVPSEGLTLF